MAEPLAYLITFRTYGTWLPGDDRGTVDDEHNRRGTPRLPPEPLRESRARREATHGVIVLAPAMRACVADAIRRVCEFRGWRLFALNARTNHVHVVASAAHTPERVMNDFKSWATRGLCAAGLRARGVPTWSRHGSTRWINTNASLQSAIDYVLLCQDDTRRWEPPDGNVAAVRG